MQKSFAPAVFHKPPDSFDPFTPSLYHIFSRCVPFFCSFVLKFNQKFPQKIMQKNIFIFFLGNFEKSTNFGIVLTMILRIKSIIVHKSYLFILGFRYLPCTLIHTKNTKKAVTASQKDAVTTFDCFIFILILFFVCLYIFLYLFFFLFFLFDAVFFAF